MGVFSTSMRIVATDLIKQFGNSCVLTKITKGDYIPEYGSSHKSEQLFPTHSAPAKDVTDIFGNNGINTGLAGFATEKIVVAWFGEEVDETWQYDGNAIINLEKVMAQDDIIIYTFNIGK